MELVKTEPSLPDHPMFPHYFDYCVKSLTVHGQHVAEKLVTERHFLLWAGLRRTSDNLERKSSSDLPQETLGVWPKTSFETCEWPTVSILFFLSSPNNDLRKPQSGSGFVCEWGRQLHARTLSTGPAPSCSCLRIPSLPIAMAMSTMRKRCLQRSGPRRGIWWQRRFWIKPMQAVPPQTVLGFEV